VVSGGIGVREKPCAGYWVAKQCSTLHQQPWNDLARQVPPGGLPTQEAANERRETAECILPTMPLHLRSKPRRQI
jgi:hypothetical protein